MTNPADNPCTCRACGVLILNEVVSICHDCEAESDSLAEEARKIDNAIHGRSDCDCDYDPDRGCDIGDAEAGRMWWLDDSALDAEIDRELHRISAKIEFLERKERGKGSSDDD